MTSPPKDLKIKIGTKAEVMWTELRTQTKILIESDEKSLIVNREILKLCDEKIAQEQEKGNI